MKFLILFFVCLVITCGISAQSEVKNYPLLNSLNQINKNTPDTCRITAFVNSIYTCPPCPKGAECKPCIGDHIMIADSLNSKKLFRVFADEPDKFSIAKKYSFIIKLLKYDSQNEVYEAKLIATEGD